MNIQPRSSGCDPGCINPAGSAPAGAEPAQPAAAGAEPVTHLDLRGTPCPLNFVRSRLALSRLPLGAELLVDLDRGDPERMVVDGLREQGQQVQVLAADGDGVRLRITRRG